MLSSRMYVVAGLDSLVAASAAFPYQREVAFCVDFGPLWPFVWTWVPCGPLCGLWSPVVFLCGLWSPVALCVDFGSLWPLVPCGPLYGLWSPVAFCVDFGPPWSFVWTLVLWHVVDVKFPFNHYCDDSFTYIIVPTSIPGSQTWK